MSHRKTLLLLVLAIAVVIGFRKATADKGGTFDPNHPERP